MGKKDETSKEEEEEEEEEEDNGDKCDHSIHEQHELENTTDSTKTRDIVIFNKRQEERLEGCLPFALNQHPL